MPIGMTSGEVEKCISISTDSENLIYELVNDGVYNNEIYDNLDRNIRHLEIILTYPDVIASGSPKIADFTSVISIGKSFIDANSV